MKEQEYFNPFAWSYIKEEMRLVWLRYWLPFRPSFWRAFFACKGAKAKFNCWLEWPEHNVESN